MFRSIWLPSLIACAIGLPLLLGGSKQNKSNPQTNQYPGVTIYQSNHSNRGQAFFRRLWTDTITHKPASQGAAQGVFSSVRD